VKSTREHSTFFSISPHAEASHQSTVTVARAGLWALLAAHLVALWGLSWDIRWHVLIGRDSFWIAPHIMTYSGVAAIVLVSFGVFVWTGIRGSTPPVS
jgi:hypothetical protein